MDIKKNLKTFFMDVRVQSLMPAILIAIAFYFYRRPVLTDVTLDQDELFSWMLVSGSWEEFFFGIIDDTQQFLYYFLLKLWHMPMPVYNDYWVRVPSLAMACLVIGLLFHLIRQLYSEIVAGVSVTFLIFNPVFVYFSAYNRPYSLLALLGTLNIYLIWKIIQNGNGDRKGFYSGFFIISLLLMLLTHHLALIYTTSIILTLVYLKIKIVIRKWWIVPIITVFLIYFIQFCYQFKNSLKLISWVSVNPNPLGLFNYLVDLNFFGALTYISIVIFLKGLFEKKIRKSDGINIFILYNFYVVVFGISIMALTGLTVTSLVADRYFMFYLPFLLIPMAYGIKDFPKHKGHGYFIYLLFIFIGSNMHSPYYQNREDVKGFMRSLSNTEILNEKSSVLCLYDDSFVGTLGPYSQMYFKRDICSIHMELSEMTSANAGYDIVIKNISRMKNSSVSKKNPWLENRSVIYSSRDFIIYK